MNFYNLNFKKIQLYSCYFGIGILGLAVWLIVLWQSALSLILIPLSLVLVYLLVINVNINAFKIKSIIVPLIAIAILTPPIRLSTGIPDLRLEMIMVLVVWVLIFLYYHASGLPVNLYHYRFNVNKWFFLFGFSMLISILFANYFLDYSFIERDLFELIKLFIYFLLFILVASRNISSEELERIYILSLVFFLFSAFIGFAQYLNIANINEWVSPYYAPTQMRGLLVHGRITGTTPNPNEFGALMVLASSLSFSSALFFKKRKARLFSWSCLGVFLLALFFTLSRTALLSLIVALMFIFLIKYPLIIGPKKFLKKLIPLSLIFIMVIIILMQIVPEKFFTRMVTLLDFTEQASWQVRLTNWETHYEIWKESFIFGWGPGKTTMGTIVDNEWLLLLRRYGILGVTLFLLLMGSFYRGLLKIAAKTKNEVLTSLAIALQATLIAYAVYMITAAVYHSLQLMPILLLFLGLAYSQYKQQASEQSP